LNDADLRERLMKGLVIPAHPLALSSARKLDERRQRALTRYYLASGAGGIAVGVHTTQFAVHESSAGLLQPVWELASEIVSEWEVSSGEAIVQIAGIVGDTITAVGEAELARGVGYDVALVSLGGLSGRTLSELVQHLAAVGEVLPVMGFYLQPAVGGQELPYEFWRMLADQPSLVAIKVAPFDRYGTLDVVRAVCDAGRAGDVALYTGNDDHIVLDLVTPFPGGRSGEPEAVVHCVGGVLGQWAVWAAEAVRLHAECRRGVVSGSGASSRLLRVGMELTDANAAIFDQSHHFAGCIPGIHEVLRRQGLLEGTWCLDPQEMMSQGQARDIDRVLAAYPHLADDAFVAEHLDEWLA